MFVYKKIVLILHAVHERAKYSTLTDIKKLQSSDLIYRHRVVPGPGGSRPGRQSIRSEAWSEAVASDYAYAGLALTLGTLLLFDTVNDSCICNSQPRLYLKKKKMYH